mgnify:CR=1 FL=1
MQRIYLAIDLKSYYASAECAARHLDPLTTNWSWQIPPALRKLSVSLCLLP